MKKSRKSISGRERRLPLLPFLFLSLFLLVSHASYSTPVRVIEFTTEEAGTNIGNNLNKKLFSEEGNLKVTRAGKFNDPGPAHEQIVLPASRAFIPLSEEETAIPEVQASVLKKRIIPLFILYHNWRSALL